MIMNGILIIKEYDRGVGHDQRRGYVDVVGHDRGVAAGVGHHDQGVAAGVGQGRDRTFLHHRTL